MRVQKFLLGFIGCVGGVVAQEMAKVRLMALFDHEFGMVSRIDEPSMTQSNQMYGCQRIDEPTPTQVHENSYLLLAGGDWHAVDSYDVSLAFEPRMVGKSIDHSLVRLWYDG